MTQTTLEARRDRYGRYFLTPSTGGEPSLTAASRPSLGRSTTASAWSGGGRRMLIGGLVARPDLFAAGASTRPDDKDVLDSICEQAVEAGGASAGGASAGATVGSALHRFLERIDAGEDVDVPPPWDADVAAYGKVLDAGRIGIIPELIERVVAIEGLREPIAGTFDRVVEAGGRRMVADLKTGQSMNHSWPSISIQLALYAHATSMVNLATGENEPMPSVDQRQGLVIHLPAGQGVCTLHTVNLVAGWRAASLALEVRE
jgi:hypothetical protein